MNASQRYQVSDKIRTAFAEDGAVCLRGLLDEAELERLRAVIDRNMEQPNEEYAETRPGEWYFHHIYVWQRVPALADICFHSAVPEGRQSAPAIGQAQPHPRSGFCQRRSRTKSAPSGTTTSRIGR